MWKSYLVYHLKQANAPFTTNNGSVFRLFSTALLLGLYRGTLVDEGNMPSYKPIFHWRTLGSTRLERRMSVIFKISFACLFVCLFICTRKLQGHPIAPKEIQACGLGSVWHLSKDYFNLTWPGGSVGWGIVLYTRRSQVQFLIRVSSPY